MFFKRCLGFSWAFSGAGIHEQRSKLNRLVAARGLTLEPEPCLGFVRPCRDLALALQNSKELLRQFCAGK